MTTPDDRWHPILPIQVLPRPRGVFWAKVPDGYSRYSRYATGPLCTTQEHPVYQAIRPQHATMPGCQGGEKQRQFWVCAECAPPTQDEGNQG